MTKDEALNMCFEYIETNAHGSKFIRFIKEALAQPEQEPVALPEGKKLILVDGSFDDLMYWLERCEYKRHLENCPDLVEPWENFSYKPYTTPPQRKPLTDEEAQQIFAKHNCTISTHLAGILARAIEAAHGINAPTERKGEA